jgi:hypothetical protein
MARGSNNVVANVMPIRAVQALNIQSDDDKLIAWFNDADPKPLSKKLEQLFKRYDFARDVLVSKRSIMKSIPLLIKKEWGGRTITISTARRDLFMAQKLFGANLKHDRSFNVDLLLSDIQQDINIARMKGAHNSIPALRKLQSEIIEKHMGDSAADLYIDLKPHIIIVDFMPESLKTPLPPDAELKEELKQLKKAKVSDSIEAQEVTYEAVKPNATKK